MTEEFLFRGDTWYQFLLNDFNLSKKQCAKESSLCEYLFFEVSKGKISAKIIRGKQKPVFLQVTLETISIDLCKQIESEVVQLPLFRTKLFSGDSVLAVEKIFNKHKVSLIPKSTLDFELKISDIDERSKRLYVACLLGKLIEESEKNPYFFFSARGFDVANLKKKIKESISAAPEFCSKTKSHMDIFQNAHSFWGNQDVEGLSKLISYEEKDVLKNVYVKLPLLAANQKNIREIYDFFKKGF